MEKRSYSNVLQSNFFLAGNPINQVHITDDHSMFQFSKFNRNIILKREMIEQAKEGFVAPIIVNENMVVIDGQHRLKAAERVGVPVEFIIKPGLNEYDIVRMNTTQKPWSTLNHIEANANDGKEEYIKLVNLINNRKYTSNVTAVTQLALFGLRSNSVNKIIEEGNFKFINYEKTVEFLEYLSYFKDKTQLTLKTKLCLAIFEIYKVQKFNKDRLIHKVISTGLAEDLFTKTLDLSDAKKQLLEAYNHSYTEKNKNFINYSIKPSGRLFIEEEKADWACVEE